MDRHPETQTSRLSGKVLLERAHLIALLVCYTRMRSFNDTVLRGARRMTPSASSPRFLNPPSLSQPFGYTHVVETRGGRTVYVSGQVALDSAGNVVGVDDLHAQATQVFNNLSAALAAVGATFEHVVKLTYFLLDISQIAVVRAVRDRYINTQQPPASSAVEVRRLVGDEWLIEIEAIAVIPE
jgi:enamine deaminase RidA (YjgF/YER057c/UK114 family)